MSLYGELRGSGVGCVGKLGGLCKGKFGNDFQNEDGRDGKGLKWFLREAKVFGGTRP